MKQPEHPRESTPTNRDAADAQPAAGKRTRTQSIATRAPGAGPIQRRATDDAAARPAGSGGQAARGADWTQVAVRPDLFSEPSTAGGDSAAPGGDSGRTMPGAVQAKMERSLGTELSSVRVHEGPQATAMGAVAYTQGSDIHFAPGAYQPETPSGQEILGHELAHVVQQRAGRVSTPQAKGAAINSDPALEAEADRVGRLAARGEPAAVAGASATGASGSAAPIQRIAAEALDDLTEKDAEENQAATLDAAYRTAQNELGGELSGAKLGAKERASNMKTAFQLGFDFVAFLKDLNQKHGGSDKVTRIDAASDTILEYLGTVTTAFDDENGIAALMTTLEIAPESQEWLYEQLLAKGTSIHKLDKALKTIYAQERSEFAKSAGDKNAQLAFILGYLQKQEPAKKVDLDPEAFAEQEYQDQAVDPLVVESAARASSSGSTIEANPYIARHFTPVVMKFLVEQSSMPIYIYEGATSGALGDLARMGYTEVRPLSDNAVTDFRKFTARDPNSEQAVFIVVGPSGRAYQREIAAHFLYHDPPIDPGRITHKVKGADSAKKEFGKELAQLGMDPDVVLMGNVEEVRSKLGAKGIKGTGEIQSPNLYGVTYAINGRAVLSLKVEPHLYADRAGQFLEAVQAQSSKQRLVIFTGTAGGFEKNMQIGDLVAPSVFSQSDSLENEPVGGVENQAVGYFESHHHGQQGMFAGKDMSHGSVDSILFEDNAWLQAHRQDDENYLALIEQEVAGLARAVNTKLTELYAFFRISDLPGEQDFTENETNRPPPRTPVSQGDLVVAMMEEVMGELRDSSEPKGSTKPKVSQKSQKLIFSTAEHIYTIATDTYDALAVMDAKLARGLDDGVRQLIALVQAGKLSSSQFATQVTKLHELYGVVAVMERNNPDTQLRCKYSGPGPLVAKLRYNEKDKELALVDQGGGFWAVITNKPAKNANVEFELTVPGKEAPVTGTFKGGATKFLDLTR